MVGAAVILASPIFQGLAISLLFGLASSTALALLVIPAIYVALKGDTAEEAARGRIGDALQQGGADHSSA